MAKWELESERHTVTSSHVLKQERHTPTAANEALSFLLRRAHRAQIGARDQIGECAQGTRTCPGHDVPRAIGVSGGIPQHRSSRRARARPTPDEAHPPGRRRLLHEHRT